jgi:hypothetical protein
VTDTPWKNFRDLTGVLPEVLTVLRPPTTAEELYLVADELEQLARRLRLIADEAGD